MAKVNEDYGILNGQEITYAPASITKRYNPYPVDMMLDDGYHHIVRTDMPTEPPEEGYHWASHWEMQDDEIVQVWEQVEDEPVLPVDLPHDKEPKRINNEPA